MSTYTSSVRWIIGAAVLAASTAAVGQAPEGWAEPPAEGGCGTRLRPEDEMLRQVHREIARRRVEVERGLAYYTPPPILYVPLTFHVVRRTDGTGGLSQSRLDQAVADANVAFEPTRIIFCQPGPTRFIDQDYYYFECSTTTDYNQLRNAFGPVAGTINCFFTEHMESPSDPTFDICGLSSYTSSPTQGIVMKNACTAVPEDHATFPHEIGHYFDLFHTHETWGGTECANGSNCAYTGDDLCDTAAAPRLDQGNVDEVTCEYIGNEDGPCFEDDPYDPDPSNYMSYSPKPCRNKFSPQQHQKMRAVLEELRPELILAEPCPILDACGPGAGDCNHAHEGPGCDDVSCCEDVCAVDPYCCAGNWDSSCTWRWHMFCLDLVFLPPGFPHAPLGLATVMPDPSGDHLILSNIGATGDDGAVVDLGRVGGYATSWTPLDPAGALPIGAHVEMRMTGGPLVARGRLAGAAQATKTASDGVRLTVTPRINEATRYTVLLYVGATLVAEATGLSGDGALAIAPALPDGGGIPTTRAGLGPVSRFHWEWSTPVLVQIAGGPASTATRVEVHAEDGLAPIEVIEMFALTAAGIPRIELTAGAADAVPLAPPHDDCAGALPLTDAGVAFSTLGAGTGSGLPSCAGSTGYGGDVWFRYTASCTGPVTIGTCDDTSFDTVVTVYADDCANLVELACSDDAPACAGGGSRTTFEAECRSSYLVRVGGDGGATGTGTLVVTCAGSCPPICTGDLDGDLLVNFADLVQLLAGWGPCAGCPGDLDGDLVIGFGDLLLLLGAWGPCPDVE